MPREGCKLLVRNSKGGGQEEYYVDSIEVISFGASFFFRSQERPKSFLVPVTDYEILEQKEVRLPLKNVAPERSIKIGGGREASLRPARESAPEPDGYEGQERDRPESLSVDQNRKRDKRRRNRRGGSRADYSVSEPRNEEPSVSQEDSVKPSEGKNLIRPERGADEAKPTPGFISKLFPPPPTLIKDTLSRYKLMDAGDAPPMPDTEYSELVVDELDSQGSEEDRISESPQSREKKGKNTKDILPSEETP